MLSSFLRILSGLVLIGLSYLTFSRNRASIDAGQPLEILGGTIAASPAAFYSAVIAAGVIGLILLALGFYKLTARRP